MNSLEIFQFNNLNVRVFVNENNEPEFCASDITKILGYSNGPQAIDKNCSSKGISKRDTLTQGGLQSLTYINEGNLYRLILKSNKPEAELFERWVCDEVIPSIRKHGAYLTSDAIEKALNDPDTIIQLATQLKRERADRERLQYQNELQQKQLVSSAPKVEYYDNVLQSENTYTTTQIAKELGMGAPTLNDKLRLLGIQYKQSGQWLLVPRFQDKGYTKTRTFSFTRHDGTNGSNIETVWTEKGREFIHKVISSSKTSVA